ncbi:hypothetical protein BB560_006456, partial [Smittium megazygosporum]
ISIAGLRKLQPSIPAVNNELAINNGSINLLDSELERYGDPSGIKSLRLGTCSKNSIVQYTINSIIYKHEVTLPQKPHTPRLAHSLMFSGYSQKFKTASPYFSKIRKQQSDLWLSATHVSLPSAPQTLRQITITRIYMGDVLVRDLLAGDTAARNGSAFQPLDYSVASPLFLVFKPASAMTVASDFSSIPILDLDLLAQGKDTLFLEQLQNSIFHVGFFYVKNHGIPQQLFDRAKSLAEDFFDLPQEIKDKSDKIHSSSFLGYSKQGFEITKGKKDNREQYDYGEELNIRWEPGMPEYMKLYAPFPWPSDEDVNGFRATYLELLDGYKKLSTKILSLIARALELPADSFDQYFTKVQQSRGKIIKYPAISELNPDDGNQGVGPHIDSAGLITILYQASDLPGLQVQNHSGQWIDATPIPGTLVVNLQNGLDVLTGGITPATTHRVLSPPAGRGPRYSIPFFEGVRLDKPLKVLDIPKKFDYLKSKTVISDSEKRFNHMFLNDFATAMIYNRITSHSDVGVEYYPELAENLGIKQ